jgi:hypothetical protein
MKRHGSNALSARGAQGDIIMKRYRILIAAALFLAAGTAAAEIVLYENENFNGRRFATGGSVPNLQYAGFNDLASSVIVRSGSWQLCSEPFFRSGCVTLGPGEYPSLNRAGLNDRVSSVREVGSLAAPAPPPGGAPGPVGGAPRVQLFETRDFSGRSVVVDRDVEDFYRINFNDVARSAIVSGGTWELCEHAQYRGNCVTVGPGRHRDLGRGVEGDVSSARLIAAGGGPGPGPAPGPGPGPGAGGGWGGGARVVMYSGPNFSGRSHVVDTNIVRDLGSVGFNDRASSLRVERGYWMFCSEPNYDGECRTFAPGDYATLPPGLDNRISSGRRISSDYPYNQPPNWGRP